MKSNKILEKVNDYFNLQKSKNLTKQLNIEEQLLANEKYLNTVNEIGKINFQIAKASFDGEIEKVEKLSIELENLQQIKLSIESQPEYNNAITYNCKICNDTGYKNGKRCICFNKALVNACFNELGVNEQSKQSFSSTIPDSLTKHYALMQEYSNTFPNTNLLNFVFIGSPGTGKTYLSKCIENEVTKNGYLAIFLSATDLTNIFLKMHLSEIEKSLIFDILSTCDLLIIDDLGTEPIYKNVTVEYLLTLITMRLDKNKHFIITTNLSTSELYERYNERLLSRLSDKSKTIFIPFNSEDLRRTLK